MKSDLDTALDECLFHLGNGADLEACLARFPQCDQELRPLLRLAAALRTVVPPPPSEAARAAGRRHMLATFEKQASQAVSKPVLSRYAVQLINLVTRKEPENMRLAWTIITAIAVAVLALSGVATVAASESSLPGDALYPVKLGVQKARVALTFDAKVRQEREEKFVAQRRQDVQIVLAAGRQTRVEFQGRLEQMEADIWIVGGLPVVLTAETAIEGRPEPGALVSVLGQLPGDGSLIANQLTVVEPVPGTFDSPLPTPTMAPGETATPTEAPEPTGTPEPTETPDPGDDHGTPGPSETLELDDDHGTPELTETPEPDDDYDTPELTETPESDDDHGTPKPTGTPEPDDDHDTPELTETPESDDDHGTPKPTGTPEPDDDHGTPEPTHTPAPTEAPRPTATVEPTRTPEPTEAPEPTETREPDDTPEPEETDEPDDTPEPEETDEPDDTPEPEATKTPDD